MNFPLSLRFHLTLSCVEPILETLSSLLKKQAAQSLMQIKNKGGIRRYGYISVFAYVNYFHILLSLVYLLGIDYLVVKLENNIFVSVLSSSFLIVLCLFSTYTPYYPLGSQT